MARYELRETGVFDNVLGKRITRSDIEWTDYRQWLRTNTPDPMPVPASSGPSPEEVAAAAEIAARATMRDSLRSDGTVHFLRTHTPAEVATYVQTNVTDLASARNVLAKLSMVVAYLARERLALDPPPRTPPGTT